jgi:hypothetical protein
VYRVRFGSPQWLALAPVIARVHAPGHSEGVHAKRVPPHLLHLFCNAAPAQLDVALTTGRAGNQRSLRPVAGYPRTGSAHIKSVEAICWHIRWTGVLSPLNDPAYFARVTVDRARSRKVRSASLPVRVIAAW